MNYPLQNTVGNIAACASAEWSSAENAAIIAAMADMGSCLMDRNAMLVRLHMRFKTRARNRERQMTWPMTFWALGLLCLAIGLFHRRRPGHPNRK